jgi:hypothetical protein
MRGVTLTVVPDERLAAAVARLPGTPRVVASGNGVRHETTFVGAGIRTRRSTRSATSAGARRAA